MDVTITLKLDPPSTRAKELEVVLSTSHFKVRRRDNPTWIIDGEFSKPIRLDESSWWIDDGVLTCQVVKIKRAEWWFSAFVGGIQITYDDIQPEHPTFAEDLDPESQALVKKMMHENEMRQKAEAGYVLKSSISFHSTIIYQLLVLNLKRYFSKRYKTSFFFF